MKTIIKAVNIKKTYKDRVILKDISLALEEGKCIAFVGSNGCGKSTLLRILSGLTRPDSGRIDSLDSLKIGFIPDHIEKTNMSPGRVLGYFKHMNNAFVGEECMDKYIKEFRLEHVLNTPMKYLSKGTLQKIAVIQALLTKNDVMFLDEPLSGQDIFSQLFFIGEMKARKNNGMGVIMSCHEKFLMEELADQIYEIKDGLIQDGTEYLYGKSKKRSVFLIKGQEEGMKEFSLALKPIGQLRKYGSLYKIEADTDKTGDILKLCLDFKRKLVKYQEADEIC